ncbi:MAG TPA: hemerythrin domain-containing protein [Casimicrobiaceae bacterium]|nr:hemerythrin domain-containing protein [Casimicrobiaceae bacterium]
MNPVNKLVPSITTMIRADHALVMSTFHKYRLDASPQKKKAIVETICSAVEIHAKLEEELFYPAMRGAQPDLVEKSAPEHNEVRRQIASLRSMDPAGDEYDIAFFGLMRSIIHHVADEETVLLPAAERVLSDRLGELGLAMTRRRMELAAPRAGEIALNAARSHAGLLTALGALLAVGGVLAYRGTSRRSLFAWPTQRRVRKLVERPTQRLLGYMRHA